MEILEELEHVVRRDREDYVFNSARAAIAKTPQNLTTEIYFLVVLEVGKYMDCSHKALSLACRWLPSHCTLICPFLWVCQKLVTSTPNLALL